MRWLLLPFGLAAAALAGWLLLSTPAGPEAVPEARDGSAESRGAPAVGARPAKPKPAPRATEAREAPVREHIDDASRRELDGLLEREGLSP